MHAQLRPLCRFAGPTMLHVLAEGLAHEQRLRQRIMELKELRRNGVRTFAQAEEFELRCVGCIVVWGREKRKEHDQFLLVVCIGLG